VKNTLVILLTGVAVLFGAAGCTVASGTALFASATFWLCAAVSAFFLGAFLTLLP
jgi:hypothetical protein